jgi:uncharacterized protein
MMSAVVRYIRHPAFARAFPFGVFVAFIAISGPLDRLGTWIGMDPRWWYAVRIVLVGGSLAWFWRGYEELRSIASVHALDWLLACMIGLVVFVLWINLAFFPLSFGSSLGFDPRTDGAVDWVLAMPRLAGAVVLVPVMEELFWRSLVMRWLQDHDFLAVPPSRVGFRAFAVSALLFGLEHHLWFAGLLAGLAYGWLYMRAGNLWVPILSHGVTNGLLGAWVIYTQSWEFW